MKHVAAAMKLSIKFISRQTFWEIKYFSNFILLGRKYRIKRSYVRATTSRSIIRWKSFTFQRVSIFLKRTVSRRRQRSLLSWYFFLLLKQFLASTIRCYSIIYYFPGSHPFSVTRRPRSGVILRRSFSYIMAETIDVSWPGIFLARHPEKSLILPHSDENKESFSRLKPADTHTP